MKYRHIDATIAPNFTHIYIQPGELAFDMLIRVSKSYMLLQIILIRRSTKQISDEHTCRDIRNEILENVSTY